MLAALSLSAGKSSGGTAPRAADREGALTRTAASHKASQEAAPLSTRRLITGFNDASSQQQNAELSPSDDGKPNGSRDRGQKL